MTTCHPLRFPPFGRTIPSREHTERREQCQRISSSLAGLATYRIRSWMSALLSASASPRSVPTTGPPARSRGLPVRDRHERGVSCRQGSGIDVVDHPAPGTRSRRPRCPAPPRAGAAQAWSSTSRSSTRSSAGRMPSRHTNGSGSAPDVIGSRGGRERLVSQHPGARPRRPVGQALANSPGVGRLCARVRLEQGQPCCSAHLQTACRGGSGDAPLRQPGSGGVERRVG